MNHGKLVLVNGPSGSGKGSLVRHAREIHPELAFSISCTTRAPRPGEVDGSQYHFVSVDTFKEKIAAGDFLEWAEFGGNYYGTLKSEVEPVLARGGVIILEIELNGVRQVLANMPREDILTIFIDAGSWEALEARVVSRAPIGSEELARRKQHYFEDAVFKDEADVVIQNYDGMLSEADARFEEIITALLAGEK